MKHKLLLKQPSEVSDLRSKDLCMKHENGQKIHHGEGGAAWESQEVVNEWSRRSRRFSPSIRKLLQVTHYRSEKETKSWLFHFCL